MEAPGVSLTDVRDFLGHRDVSQTNTYLATTPQRLRAVIENGTRLAQTSHIRHKRRETPRSLSCNPLIVLRKLVGMTGFEPATP